MLLVLLLLSSGSLAQREGLKVNRRARQRLPQRRLVIQEDPVLPPIQPAQPALQGSDVDEYQWADSQAARQAENITPYSEPNYKQTALSVFNEQSFGVRQYLPSIEPEPYVDFSVLSDDQPQSGSDNSETRERSQFSETQQVLSRRARLPRRRTQLANRRDETNSNSNVQSDRDSYKNEIRQRSRSALETEQELQRGVRAGSVSRTQSGRRLRSRVDRPVQNRIGQATTPTRTRSRSRSRHRSRSQALEVTTSGYNYTPAQESRSSRGRLGERTNSRTLKPSSSGINHKKKSSPKSGLKVHFPKKNLFPSLPKFKTPQENSVDTRKSSFQTKSKSSGRSRGRYSPKKDIRPSQSYKTNENDYQNVDLQSGKQDSSETTPSVITVTHQVPTRTVFTIVEGGETKSLHADTFKTSLQILDVSELKSTEINSHRVVYAHVQTNHPQFGVKEYEYDAIQPTRTFTTEERELNIGGRRTSVVDTIYSTIYNVEKITARVTDTPSVNHVEHEQVNQIGAILQDVILKLIGGGLLGNNVQIGGPTIHGPPRTQFITHTRSFLTTTTSMETIVLPVNFRGSQIYQTVTDLKTLTTTTTDYSVQTLLNYEKPSDEPFLPLAPVLHRAARVVPAEPLLNTLPIFGTTPASFSTSYVTHTHTSVKTISTDITSDIIITLGGREIQTEISQPTTQVVTSTSLSTQSLLVQPRYHQQNDAASKLELIKALLRLRN